MATNVPTYRCNVCHEFFKTSWERDQHFHNAYVPTPISTLPLSESEKFFAHLNNGEVSLVPFKNMTPPIERGHASTTQIGFRVVISPKVGE